MVFFQKIKWKNFLATGNNFIEVELDKSKTSILLGPSGSGKSTLLDAICFSLFGRAFRAINKDQLVNSVNERDCLVEIEFKIGTKQYLVRRGIKPNIFEIYRNGKLIEQDASVYDYQGKLEKQILKFNRKTFTQIVVLGASNFTPFMQLKPSDRRIIIEELLDIEIFTIMFNLLKEKISKLKAQTSDNNIQIYMLEKEIILHEKYVKSLSKDKNLKIAKNKEDIEKNLLQVDLLKNLIVGIEQSVIILEEKIKDENSTNSNVQRFYDLQNQIERNVKKAENEINFYVDHDDCPTCKQSIDKSFKEAEVQRKQQKLLEFSDGLKQIENTISSFENRLSEIHSIKKSIEENNKEKRNNASSIKALVSYIKRLKFENEELEKPKKRISDGKENIKSLINDKNICVEHTKNFANFRALYDTSGNLLKDGGIKSRIIKQYLPLINKYVNKYLNSMTFFVSFHLDEEFNESIKSRGRDTFSYSNFSEGEKQRIDLALLFTWRAIARMKNSVNTNLLIMDEVFDSYLDNAATENVIELLNSELFNKTNIFVISHKDTIADKFHRVIRFNKVKSFSRIE